MSRKLWFDHWSGVMRRRIGTDHDMVAVFRLKDDYAWFCDDMFVPDESLGTLECRQCGLTIPVPMGGYWRETFLQKAKECNCDARMVTSVMES
jgi:hypothetical protein